MPSIPDLCCDEVSHAEDLPGEACVFQELTADADKEVRIRRNDGGAIAKLEQQENLLLKAKIAHARQLLQHNADHSSDLLR